MADNWKVGDRALTKPMTGGHIYLGAEEAERLGIKAGTDGWKQAEVVADPLPGSDWIYVEEGAELTPEQAARKFLSLDWDAQVARMERFLDDAGAAAACHMLNHDGAMIFSRNHSCPPDRYQEGWEQGWKDAFDEMQKRVAALGN